MGVRKSSWHSVHSYSIKNGLSGDRISVFARFSATFQAGSGIHTASGKMGPGFFFSGLKSLGHGLYYPPPSSVEVKERLEEIFLPLWTSTSSHIYIKEPTWCSLAVCLFVTAILLYMFRTLFSFHLQEHLETVLAASDECHAARYKANINRSIYKLY